jgi:hypothetical protein
VSPQSASGQSLIGFCFGVWRWSDLSTLDGFEWDGGSLLPDEAEAGVKYYLGVPDKKSDGKNSFGVVREIDRHW